MATTYLQLTNELLRELNEVALTSANFSTAIGIQQHVKDCVNRAYLDIVTEEPTWPFLAVAESGTVNPYYGNVSVDTVAGTRWYELKPSSNSLVTDYGYIDWDNFYITTAGLNDATSPFTSRNLKFTTIEEFKDFFRPQENQSQRKVVDSLISTALLEASTSSEPEATLFNVEISGRKLGDINNSGAVTSTDVLDYIKYTSNILEDQDKINYINNVFKPYLIENHEDYAAYLTFETIPDSWGEPKRVLKSPDNRKFALSPIPDKVYRVWFYAYALPTELANYGDTIVFPDVYKTVLLSKARYYLHQFKENSQAAAFALEDYKRGLRLMKSNLMDSAPVYMKDDRMRFI